MHNSSISLKLLLSLSYMWRCTGDFWSGGGPLLLMQGICNNKVSLFDATEIRALFKAASGGSPLERNCAQDGGAVGDRTTTLFKASNLERRQGDSCRDRALVQSCHPPKCNSQGPPPSSFLRAGGGVWQGWLSLASVPSWRPLYYCFTAKTRW